MWVQSLSWEDPWSSKAHPTPVFLPRKFHGERSLVGYSPWSLKALDSTELTAATTLAAISLFALYWCSVCESL